MLSFLFLAAALAFTPHDADLAHQAAAAFVESCTPRDAGTIRGKIAANFILDEASKTGADVRRHAFTAETPNGPRTFTNLACEFQCPGVSNWIVFVSHFDTKPDTNCPGANDGAATSALLMSLANVLGGASDLKVNVMLIWTDGEESMRAYAANDGFWGSKHAAEALKKSGRAVKAVFCLDMLGDSDLKITIPANGTDALARRALKAAETAGVAAFVARTTNEVKDDHVAFLNQGFDAIDLIDFEYGPGNAYWHTPDDTMIHVSKESLLKSGRLAVELINSFQ